MGKSKGQRLYKQGLRKSNAKLHTALKNDARATKRWLQRFTHGVDYSLADPPAEEES